MATRPPGLLMKAPDPDNRKTQEVSDERRRRWDELTFKLEQLMMEYKDVILDPEDATDEHGINVALPDWDNMIFALADWSFVFSILDTEPEVDKKGFWVLHIEPANQLPYRTRGLLEHRLDLL